MRRLRKWLFVLGGLVVFLALAVFLTWIFFGPAIAKKIITGKLRAMGIEESAFEVDRLWINEIELSRIVFGPDSWLQVENAIATYGPIDLLFGKLKTLTLDSATWTIRADENEIVWGLPSPTEGGGPVVPDLPFDRIDINYATIVFVDQNGAATKYTLNSEIIEEGTNHLRGAARIGGEMNVSLDAEVRGAEDIDLVILGVRIDDFTIPAALEDQLRPYIPFDRIDSIDLQANYDGAAEGNHHAVLKLEAAVLGDEVIEEAKIIVIDKDDAISWSGSAKAAEWNVSAADGVASGLDSVLAEERDIRASALVEVEGSSPAWVDAQLRTFGWQIDEGASATVRGRVSARYGGGESAMWEIMSEHVAVQASAPLAAGEGATLLAPWLRGWVSFRATPALIEVDAVGEMMAGASEVAFGSTLLRDVNGLVAAHSASAPLFRMERGESGPIVTSAARIIVNEPVRFASAEFSGEVAGVEGVIVVTPLATDGESASEYAIDVSLHVASASLDETNIEFSGIDVEAPILVAREANAEESAGSALRIADIATLSLEEIAWKERRFAGFDAILTLANGQLHGRTRWAPIENGVVDVDLRADLTGDSPRGLVRWHSVPFEITDESELATLITGTDEWLIGGLYALDGMYGFGVDATDPHLLISVRNGSVSREDEKIALRGIEGSIELDRFSPLLTPGRQRVTVESGTLGELTVTGGEIEAEITGDGLVQVHRFIASMGEYGSFLAEPFAIDPAHPALDTAITARNMSLAPWLELITQGRARGEGRLSGRIDVAWDSDRPQQFTIRESTLAAEPSQGTITISEENDLRALLVKSDPRFQDDEFMSQVGDNIVAAIQDYLFTSLEVEFQEGRRGTEMHIVTSGRGRQGVDAQEIGMLTLNFFSDERVLYLAVMDRERLKALFDSE